jgi:hypothetical protein
MVVDIPMDAIAIYLNPESFAFHTPEFNKGYVDGFCSVDPHGGSDAEVATFNCP